MAVSATLGSHEKAPLSFKQDIDEVGGRPDAARIVAMADFFARCGIALPFSRAECTGD
jgi:hypothetical protein